MVSFMALKTGAQVTVIRLPMVSSVFELTLLAACLFHERAVLVTAMQVEREPPGADIPIDRATLDEQREKVYEYDWFNV